MFYPDMKTTHEIIYTSRNSMSTNGVMDIFNSSLHVFCVLNFAISLWSSI